MAMPVHIALISATWHADLLQGASGSCKAALDAYATAGNFLLGMLGALESIR